MTMGNLGEMTNVKEERIRKCVQLPRELCSEQLHVDQ